MTKKNKDTPNAFGCVYKLHHKSQDLGNDFYIGSTTNINERKRCHLKNCINPKLPQHNFKVYQFIREHGGFDAWELEPMEKYSNITTRELERHEQRVRDELLPNLNQVRSGSSISHIYQIDPNEYNRQNALKYYQEHRDEQIEKMNQKFTCDCGGVYGKTHKLRHLKSIKHQQWVASQSVVE